MLLVGAVRSIPEWTKFLALLVFAGFFTFSKVCMYYIDALLVSISFQGFLLLRNAFARYVGLWLVVG